jgi:hypothetical protein
MAQLGEQHLRRYLESRLGGSVQILAVCVLGQEAGAKKKVYGYGVPVKIEYELTLKKTPACCGLRQGGPSSLSETKA